jgi:uncharacterized DUF497 family protein
MLSLQVEKIEIDEAILEKIESKHRVSFEEVEEACFSQWRHIQRGRLGVYKLFGRTEGGRLLFVVFVDLGGRVWKVVTARPMTVAERRIYQRSGRS